MSGTLLEEQKVIEMSGTLLEEQKGQGTPRETERSV